MWKVIVLVAAVTLGLAGGAFAAEKVVPEVRQKQMEELGAIRGRLTFKLEELRRQITQPTLQTRSTAINDNYTKTRNAVNNKISLESGKAMKDQPTLDALAQKLVTMDAALNKMQRAWQVYQNAVNDQADATSYLSQMMGLCTMDDYWNRSDMDVQLLVNLAAAIEGRADQAKTKVAAAIAEVTAAIEESELVMKE